MSHPIVQIGDPLDGTVSGILEVFGAFLWSERVKSYPTLRQVASTVCGWAPSHRVLKLGEVVRDGVRVEAAGQRNDEVGAPSPDGSAVGLALVAAEDAKDDDVADLKDLLNVEPEEIVIDRPSITQGTSM